MVLNVLIPILFVVCVSDFVSYCGDAFQKGNAYCNLFITHVLYFVVAIITKLYLKFCNKEFCDNFKTYVVLLFAFFTMMNCMVISLFDQQIHGQISSYFLGIFAVATILILEKKVILFLLGVTHISFLIGIFYFQTESVMFFGHFMNSSIMVVLAFVVSRYLYLAEAESIKANKELEKNNLELEEKIEKRSAELLSSQRMALVGMNTAQIIHNLKSPLTILKGYLEIKLINEKEDEILQKMHKALLRLEDIIKTILNSSKDVDSESESCFLVDNLIREEVNLILATDAFFKHHIELSLKLKSNAMLKGYASQFSQFVCNLIQNAIHSMHSTDNKVLSISTTLKANLLIISIKDTGVGIPKEHYDKIFNPFFTTKPKVAENNEPTGTGLGLSYCKDLVESYRGQIELESQEMKGTEFIIKLPYYKIV